MEWAVLIVELTQYRITCEGSLTMGSSDIGRALCMARRNFVNVVSSDECTNPECEHQHFMG